MKMATHRVETMTLHGGKLLISVVSGISLDEVDFPPPPLPEAFLWEGEVIMGCSRIAVLFMG